MSVVRIAPSWITSASLMAGSTYLVTNWTIQSDQPWPWLEPTYTPMHRQRFTNTLNGSRIGDGFYVCRITFERLTALQIKYIETNILTNSGEWGYATVAVPKRNGDLAAYQGILRSAVDDDRLRTDRFGMAVDKDVFYDVSYDFVQGTAV